MTNPINTRTLESLSDQAKKSEDARRWKKDHDIIGRSAYQIDVSKIIHSDPFRRLSNKTQVFMSRELDQHSRTRLTHTLEVAQSAKTIGQKLELNTDLIEAIALGHDLGHTPYGHAGEAVLNEKMNAIGKSFNHNVQSVWLLQKLDYRMKDIDGVSYPGLNLTYDVLEGIWKHTKTHDQLDEYMDGLKFLSPDTSGPLEAQVVNKADSLSYLYHDINDAVRNRIITLDEFVSDVWSKEFDYNFNPYHWHSYFLRDLIENSIKKNSIELSSSYEKAYKAIRDYLYERVIKSEKIMKIDSECKEKVSVIYDYYIQNVDIILGKNKRNNQYKYNNYGSERVVVDYIQWLGDANADQEYNKIIRGNKS